MHSARLWTTTGIATGCIRRIATISESVSVKCECEARPDCMGRAFLLAAPRTAQIGSWDSASVGEDAHATAGQEAGATNWAGGALGTGAAIFSLLLSLQPVFDFLYGDVAADVADGVG